PKTAAGVSSVSHDVADHGVRVAALGIKVGVGVIFSDAPEAVLLVPVNRPPWLVREEAGDPRGVRGRGQEGHGASHRPNLAQATRPRSSPSMPQFPAPAIA